MNRLLPILGIVSLLGAIACEETYDPPGTTPRRWPDLTSPANVLKTVEISFNERNVDYLKKSLDPEFIFYPDPRDFGRELPPNNPPPPTSWDYESFCRVANNMFEEAYTIDLSINTSRVGEPEPEENTYLADNIELALLVMVDERNGYVADGYCNFELESYPTKERKKNWRLTKLWDRTAPVNGKSNGIKPMSLGRVLALYYPE